MGNKFTEEDYKKVMEYLNMVAGHAKFDLNTNELIKYYGLLSVMQTQILPKIKENILEVVRVVESEEPPALPEKE